MGSEKGARSREGCRPELARIGHRPILVDPMQIGVEVVPSLVDPGPNLVEIGGIRHVDHLLSGFGQSWAMSAGSSKTWANVGLQSKTLHNRRSGTLTEQRRLFCFWFWGALGGQRMRAVTRRQHRKQSAALPSFVDGSRDGRRPPCKLHQPSPNNLECVRRADPGHSRTKTCKPTSATAHPK